MEDLERLLALDSQIVRWALKRCCSSSGICTVRDRRQGTLSGVQIADSARRHGVGDQDIRAAVGVPLRLVAQGEDRVLVIGALTPPVVCWRLSCSILTTNR